MNVKFLNPFVEAAYEVLKAETRIEVNRGELSLDKSPYQTDDVTVIIALVGAVEGTVFYSMNEATASNFATLILGEEQHLADSLAQSGIAELGNVITGRATVLLAQAGYEANISPPTLLLGRGATISTLDFPRLVVPLVSESGTLMIHIALREGASRSAKTSMIAVPDKPNVI